MHQRFNPQDWLPNDNRTEIDRLVSRIEAAHMDIRIAGVCTACKTTGQEGAVLGEAAGEVYPPGVCRFGYKPGYSGKVGRVIYLHFL